MRKNDVRRSQGFTLIELLIVIGVIAVLAAVLLPNFTGAQKSPRNVAALQCGRAVVAAQTVRHTETQTYATNISALGEDVAEECQDVEVAAATRAQTTDGDGGIAVAGTNWAFSVWHKGGSKTYSYDKEGGVRLRPN